MNKPTIYVNPACSNCRRALTILENQGIQPNIIEYLAYPLDIHELAHIISLGITPSELIRTKESAWQDLKIDLNSVSTEKLIDILSKNPSIMQRPIIVTDDKAFIARPPETLLDML